ncbi:hypothetical protein MalM14_46530 [Gimesia chilikensis]|nr:hypothetical protein MalM14_46530 [Gimesia chilikensis]
MLVFFEQERSVVFNQHAACGGITCEKKAEKNASYGETLS